MDVFIQGEWFEFRFPNGKILKLKLRPASYEEQLKWPDSDQVNFYNLALENVIDWDLRKGGEKIEPTPENIRENMKYFLTSEVERVGGPGEAAIAESGPVEDEEKSRRRTLGSCLISILQNIENFLGN
jgi:hypothetical protein